MYKKLKKKKLYDSLKEKIFSDKFFFLGICVGMQILFDESEEGQEDGIGIFKGSVRKFISDKKFKIPHMGWNSLILKNKKLKVNLDNRVYFCHSYYAECKEKSDIVTVTSHGNEFPSIVGKKKIYGFQFHPEKSYQTGESLINQFINL